MVKPIPVRGFEFIFIGEDPMKILGGPTYRYMSEALARGGAKIEPSPASQEMVTIFEVTGMTMKAVIDELGQERLATRSQTVEIAEKQRDIQEMGRFYAAGGVEWYAEKYTKRVFFFLDNNVASSGIRGRSSHIDVMDEEGFSQYSIDAGRWAFVAVVGTI